MRASEETACREVVHSFCTAMNEWERIYSTIQRISDGQFVSQKDRNSVAGTTREGHLQEHARVFAQHVVPRDRKYGANPGEPKSWSAKGSFFDVSGQPIGSVEFRDDAHAELVTDWGYMLPGGQTMFVLKRSDGRWLIDSLKTRRRGEWETADL
jgi:hypothetical protein